MHRGKLVIVSMVGLALALAGYAWWHHYQQGRRALALWGVENARLIRHAPRVELLTLAGEATQAKGGSRAETLEFSGAVHRVSRREDISRAPGLIHARHALIEDASFEWQANADSREAHWEYVLAITEGERTRHVALDLKRGAALLVEEEREARLVERIQRALEKYISDRFERPKGNA
jgi:hypothetical protein